MANNLFITGKIRCGKSTLLKELIDPLQHITGGFFVQRLFINNESKAFRMVDLTKEAYLPNLEVRTLVGFSDMLILKGAKNIIHYDVFRTIGIDALRYAANTKQLVLMDELGKMEIKVPEFTQTVFEILDKEIPVLGVLKKDNNPFLNQIRNRPDVSIFDLDDDERNLVKDKIRQFLNPIGNSIGNGNR